MIATHFTGAIFSASKARVAPWYVYHKRRATRLAGKSARPFGWVIAVHRVRCGAYPMHRIALRTAPARVNRYDPMKWVAVTEIWY